MKFNHLVLAGLSFCAATSVFQNANAQSLVLGDGAASSCYLSVRHGDPGRASTIKNCKGALVSIDLGKKDKAATHVNLGILYMRAKQYEKARTQYDKALSMTPKLAEAHINLSAILIYTGEYNKAIDTVNTAIGLGTSKMPEALFNRAMAYDHLKQYDNAYRDLKRALDLRPNWLPAVGAINNYEVTTKPATH